MLDPTYRWIAQQLPLHFRYTATKYTLREKRNESQLERDTTAL